MPAPSLQPHPSRRAPSGPVMCVVMDGVGLGPEDESDAVHLAHTPTLDWLRTLPSFVPLLAHGTAVGMPSDGDMGNSEVGHNVLGAGRVFDQGAKLVAGAIADGSIFEGEVWQETVRQVRQAGTTLHFIGLLSDGNVHSHLDHLLAMLRRAAGDGVSSIRVHALLDGRDVPARSALDYLEPLEATLAELRGQGVDARVGSGGGRMVTTMDRYQADWSIVERGYRAHVHGEGRRFQSPKQAVETMYAETEAGDQDLPPFVIADDDGPVGMMADGDAVIFFNFRGDRALEITRAFEEEDFSEFDRGDAPRVSFAGMMQYDGDLHLPRRYLVAPPVIDAPMGQLLARAGRRQFACSETQKFGHVTYFWNGNRSGKFSEELETYVEVPSDRENPATRPWMKAAEIVDAVIRAHAGQRFDFGRINFANGDMVGHTGDLEAARLAVECVDLSLGRLVRWAREHEAVLVVTADHGNADHMFDVAPDQGRRVKTSHSLYPVPLAIFDPREADGGPALAPVERPQLGHVAPTCLELLGFTVPEGWFRSLLAT